MPPTWTAAEVATGTVITTCIFTGLQRMDQTTAEFPIGVTVQKSLLHAKEDVAVLQTIPGDGEILLAEVSCSAHAQFTSPTRRGACEINHMELTTITVRVVDQQAVENGLGILTLFQALKSTDAEIGVGVSLGRHSADSGADVGNG